MIDISFWYTHVLYFSSSSNHFIGLILFYNVHNLLETRNLILCFRCVFLLFFFKDQVHDFGFTNINLLCHQPINNSNKKMDYRYFIQAPSKHWVMVCRVVVSGSSYWATFLVKQDQRGLQTAALINSIWYHFSVN